MDIRTITRIEDPMSITSLPVLDLSLAHNPDTAEQFRTQLREATHEVGFFYLVGHGIPDELQRRLLAVAREFFALPTAEKLAIENVRSPHFRGYTRLGGELTEGKQDWREQIDIGAEQPAAERTYTSPAWEILQGPNQWPDALPELRDVITEWNDTLTSIALSLLREWAVALGQDANIFDDAFAHDPSILIKVVRYPGRPKGAGSQGVGGHKDAGVLTLLYVEPGKGGLQVEHDGDWIDAPPIDGALVVNIGELLEVATGGYLKATVHRVVSPEGDGERISVPFFFNPNYAAQIPEFDLPPELAARATGVTVDANNPIHDSYGANALKSRLRAHPDVAARWWPDIVAAQSAT
ncbi:isopenicillin N synthase-like dioxygenase [Rhodococcus erythropolis]|nr:isopenicillin N synthase-like dioxygenase [Rhodococcus erythropolis]MCW2427541.1 isopenicillin N synthase-like dioxygenase [Rhodococcus erythropolis]